MKRSIFTDNYWSLTAETLFDIFESTSVCLSSNEARSRLVQFGYTQEGLVEERPPAPFYMTSEQEDAIIDGIKNRGMGYLCLHNSLWNPPPKLFEILGHESEFHPPIQAVLYKDFNQDHPITKGLDFWVENDEQFFTRLKNPNHTILFRSEGTHDHRETIAGWCFEYGKGRVVAMLPGHTEFI